MTAHYSRSPWDLSPAISLLNALALPQSGPQADRPASPPKNDAEETALVLSTNSTLGDFSSLWDYLGRPHVVQDITQLVDHDGNNILAAELDAGALKGVRWRDELDGADLEDNVQPTTVFSAASIATQNRAARRARARERATQLAAARGAATDTATDADSGQELDGLRRSPDRRSLIANLIGRPRPEDRTDGSPPTTPSPPKAEFRTPTRKLDFSSPFLWQSSTPKSPSRYHITPQDGLTPQERKAALLTKLIRAHPSEKKYLINPGLPLPAFIPLNTSPIGIHVFIDISNITIGFHDTLKLARRLPLDSRIRRIPLSFHSFSLILERGRPAAKRVLVGSDHLPAIAAARAIGYETNILERVHKAKELTPWQKKFHRNGHASAGDYTSGSETPAHAPEKWVEQAVDEILHLKILESIIDAEKPATMVLATGDAAEAEYSGGFMKMVERALGKGWVVEVVSWSLNTSNAYKRQEFRQRWGGMFRLVVLDEFAEEIIEEEEG
jgi:hypothetical protein